MIATPQPSELSSLLPKPRGSSSAVQHHAPISVGLSSLLGDDCLTATTHSGPPHHSSSTSTHTLAGNVHHASPPSPPPHTHCSGTRKFQAGWCVSLYTGFSLCCVR